MSAAKEMVQVQVSVVFGFRLTTTWVTDDEVDEPATLNVIISEPGGAPLAYWNMLEGLVIKDRWDMFLGHTVRETLLRTCAFMVLRGVAS